MFYPATGFTPTKSPQSVARNLADALREYATDADDIIQALHNKFGGITPEFIRALRAEVRAAIVAAQDMTVVHTVEAVQS